MKLAEIRELSVSEAEAKLTELKTELAKERALIVSGTRPENPGKIRKMKKEIARIFTVINEKKTEKEEKNEEVKRKK